MPAVVRMATVEAAPRPASITRSTLLRERRVGRTSSRPSTKAEHEEQQTARGGGCRLASDRRFCRTAASIMNGRGAAAMATPLDSSSATMSALPGAPAPTPPP